MTCEPSVSLMNFWLDWFFFFLRKPEVLLESWRRCCLRRAKTLTTFCNTSVFVSLFPFLIFFSVLFHLLYIYVSSFSYRVDRRLGGIKLAAWSLIYFTRLQKQSYFNRSILRSTCSTDLKIPFLPSSNLLEIRYTHSILYFI